MLSSFHPETGPYSGQTGDIVGLLPDATARTLGEVCLTASTEPEQVSADKYEELAMVEETARVVLQEAYWVFHYAQSSEGTHDAILTYLADQYTEKELQVMRQIDPADIRPPLPKKHALTKMTTSGTRRPLTDQDVADQYERRWNYMIDRVEESLYKKPSAEKFAKSPEQTKSSDLLDIALFMTVTDRTFLKTGRGHGTGELDYTRCLTREYLWTDKKAHTPRLTQMFIDIRTLLKTLNIYEVADTYPAAEPDVYEQLGIPFQNARMMWVLQQTLARTWEGHNPGQRFRSVLMTDQAK